MRICGVDIKSKEAIIVICEPSPGAANVVESNTKRIKLDDGADGPALKSMKMAIDSYLHEQKVDVVVIKERATGSMGASGVTFKIEALFQMSHNDVVLVHGNTLRTFAKKNVAGAPSGLNGYQKDAFMSAAWLLNEKGLL